MWACLKFMLRQRKSSDRKHLKTVFSCILFNGNQVKRFEEQDAEKD
jgi:hypothetical protein